MHPFIKILLWGVFVAILIFLGFLYKENKISAASPVLNIAPTLKAPTFIDANSASVILVITENDCNISYLIERSYDNVSWEKVGVRKKVESSTLVCPNDYSDVSPPSVTESMYYRYSSLDTKDNVVEVSASAKTVIQRF